MKPVTTDKLERIYALKKLRQTGKISGDEMRTQAKAIVLE